MYLNENIFMNRPRSNVRIKMTQFPGGFHLNYLKDINSTWAKPIHKVSLRQPCHLFIIFEWQLKCKLIITQSCKRNCSR